MGHTTTSLGGLTSGSGLLSGNPTGSQNLLNTGNFSGFGTGANEAANSSSDFHLGTSSDGGGFYSVQITKKIFSF